jgi:hypothetical protein
VVIFKADARTKVSGRDNPLVIGLSDFHTVDEIEQLGEALSARRAALALDADTALECPPHLCQTLATGQRLWQRLQALGDSRPCDLVAAAVLGDCDASL